MIYLKIRNWKKYQHYGNRRPPWIKLYHSLLDDFDFMMLAEVTQAHAFKLYLLAARTKNHLPYDAVYIGEHIHSRCPVDLEALIECRFLEGYGNEDRALLAEGASTKKIREDKIRVEKKRPPPTPPAQQGLNGFAEFWTAYPRKVGKGKARRIWKSLKPDPKLQQKILDVVVKYSYSQDWTRESGQFIPHPATFLHQERWDDEPDPGPSPETPDDIAARAERGKPSYDTE